MNKKKSLTLGKDRATQFQLHTLMLPGTICIILFSILPLFGLILAFKNYSVVEGVAGIFTSKWYGFQNFKIIFGNHDFTRMLVNTLGINLLGNLVNKMRHVGQRLNRFFQKWRCNLIYQKCKKQCRWNIHQIA